MVNSILSRGRHCYVDSSVLTILQTSVRIPSTPATLFQFCLFCLYSAALLRLNEEPLYLFGQIQTSQTGGQLYSDTFPPWWVLSGLSFLTHQSWRRRLAGYSGTPRGCSESGSEAPAAEDGIWGRAASERSTDLGVGTGHFRLLEMWSKWRRCVINLI